MQKQKFFSLNHETLSDNKNHYYRIKLSFLCYLKNKMQIIYFSFLILLLS